MIWNKLQFIRLFFVISIQLYFLSGCKIDDIIIPEPTDLQKRIQNLVETDLAAYKKQAPDFPGGVAIKIITANVTAFASAGLGPSVTDEIHFRAASITKTFTATAILLLQEQGKLDVNHKLTDFMPGTSEPYLPNTPDFEIPYKNSITILDLLYHRAGIFDITNFEIPMTVEASLPYKGMFYDDYVHGRNPLHTFTFDEFIKVLADTKLSDFAPRARWRYCNMGYKILGKIIERVSGETYKKYVEEKILSPSEMNNSSIIYSGTDQAIPAPYAPGYIMFDNETQDKTQFNASNGVADGSLISTTNDLAKFFRKLLKGQGVLKKETVNFMMNYISTNHDTPPGYGCGLSYWNDSGYGHTGAWMGFFSMAVFYPDKDITICIFTNAFNYKNNGRVIGTQRKMLVDDILYKAKEIVINYQK